MYIGIKNIFLFIFDVFPIFSLFPFSRPQASQFLNRTCFWILDFIKIDFEYQDGSSPKLWRYGEYTEL